MNAVTEIQWEPQQVRREVYDDLMTYRSGDPLDDALAKMLASRVAGLGAMPEWLGLGGHEFRRLLAEHFPGVPAGAFAGYGPALDPQRVDEADDLHQLFMAHAALPGQRSWRAARVLVAGCLGNDHLWQDMGLWSRQDLSGFIAASFPELAAKNERDMKWKKFFYKQLCNQEGIDTCRAPSCAVCSDYHNCFGPEE